VFGSSLRLHLARHRIRREIVQALEREIHAKLSGVRILAQLVLHRDREVRLHAGQHVIEVVERHIHELAILQLGQRLYRLARKIAEHTHDERQLLHFNRTARFHVVADIDAWRSYALQLLLRAFLCHDETPVAMIPWVTLNAREAAEQPEARSRRN